MRIAVTGAAGFLGKHLVATARARGHEVLPLVRDVDPRAPEGAVSVADLVSAPSAYRGLDALVHAAAIRHRHGIGPEGYRVANVELVSTLLGAIERTTRFVHVSSVGVYGFPRELPIDERTPMRPVTTYSQSKLEAEALVRRLAEEAAIPWTIVRPTIVYGPGDHNGMLDKMVRMIRARRYLVVGDGKNSLHHTHVDDMVDGILLAAEHPRAVGDDFIFAGPETITLGRLSALVAEALGVSLFPVHVPLRAARLVASAVDFAGGRGWIRGEPPINHEKLDVMTRSVAFDPAKAMRTLGFVPKVRYAEGIRRTLRGA